MKSGLGGVRSWYVLILLTLILSVSMLDRQIVTILAVDIKRDLDLNNSEIGLIAGTFLGIFYALFSLPLGRLADGWSRKRQVAVSLLVWSAATCGSAFARGFSSLAGLRTVVAIGEAGAAPASYSLIADLFPRDRRATAFAIYGAGTGIGVGVSTAIGGAVVDWWNGHFPGGHGWFGLVGWQAAFVVAGLPGPLLALLMLAIREPLRGISDGLVQSGEAHPFRRAGEELLALIPGLALVNLWRLKASRRAQLVNLGVLVAILVAIVMLAHAAEQLTPLAKRRSYGIWLGLDLTPHLIQWATVGLGLYATITWIQSQKLRDPAAYALMWSTPSFVAMLVVATFNMIVTYGLTAWGAPYAIQRFHAPLAEVGWKLGTVIGAAGLSGMLVGGWIADVARRIHPNGRMWVLFLSVTLPVPLAWLAFTRTTLDGFVLSHALLSLALGSWLPCCSATLHDLVLPRMRGTAIALLYLCMTIFGMGTGPYLVGLMADVTGDLGGSVLRLYALSIPVVVAMIVALRHLPRDEAALRSSERWIEETA